MVRVCFFEGNRNRGSVVKFENRESLIEFDASAAAAPLGAFCFGILRFGWGGRKDGNFFLQLLFCHVEKGGMPYTVSVIISAANILTPLFNHSPFLPSLILCCYIFKFSMALWNQLFLSSFAFVDIIIHSHNIYPFNIMPVVYLVCFVFRIRLVIFNLVDKHSDRVDNDSLAFRPCNNGPSNQQFDFGDKSAFPSDVVCEDGALSAVHSFLDHSVDHERRPISMA